MKILVSGAGIGGSAATLFLRAAGHDVTLIDKAPAFIRRGYILSLKYFGIRIMQSLGLWEDLQRTGVHFATYQLLDAKGSLLKEFPESLEEIATKGSIFVERPDLHHALFMAASKQANVRFTTHITDISQNDQTATVTYAAGGQERFDMVVIAEGLRSSTRKLLWGDEGLHSFGVIYAATKIQAPHTIPLQTFRIYFIPGSSIMLAPVNDKELFVQCYFGGQLKADHPQEQLRDLLRKSGSHLPDDIRALIDQTADRRDMFCDNVGMVSLSNISKGRAVLLGDSGYCPTFLSGMGASLALLGAKTLAETLRKEPNNVPAALKRFNTMMQPLISHYQHNARENVQQMLDTRPAHILMHNWAIRVSPPGVIVHHLAKQHHLEKSALKDFDQADF